jgi:hypothetical protein
MTTNFGLCLLLSAAAAVAVVVVVNSVRSVEPYMVSSAESLWSH